MGKRKGKRELTLDRPATYEIEVSGHLYASWSEWNGKMTVKVEVERDGPPVTALTGQLDQAALHRVMRQLYALGFPLISVARLDFE